MTLPKVVVIGGGPAGVRAAINLHGIADVTLVDRRDYLEIYYATVRVPVDANFHERLLVPFSDIPKLNAVCGHVTGITSTAVQLESGNSMPYDYLVVATGSTYRERLNKGTVTSRAERVAEYKTYQRELEGVRGVLVIGGGPVGIELAAEIATARPDIAVTLVHSGSAMVEYMKPAFGVKAKAFLEAAGVQVILGDKVEATGNGTFRLMNSGKIVRADRAFWCVGGTPDSGVLRGSNADVLDSKGAVKVDKHLQVKGRENWFAAGDITNIQETKLGYFADMHGALVAKNIAAMIKDGRNAKLAAWKPGNGMDVMLASLGKRNGVMQALGCVCTGFLPTKIKSSDLLVGRVRAQLGLKD